MISGLLNGFPKTGGTPIAGWFLLGKNPSFEMDDDWRYPHDSGSLHISWPGEFRGKPPNMSGWVMNIAPEDTHLRFRFGPAMLINHVLGLVWIVHLEHYQSTE